LFFADPAELSDTLEHKRGVVIKFKFSHVLPFVAALLHPIVLRTQTFMVLMVTKLFAGDICNIAQTFTDSYKYVYDDIKILTVKFYKFATFQLIVVSHLSGFVGFRFSVQVIFYLNFLNYVLIVLYNLGHFVLDQFEQLKNF